MDNHLVGVNRLLRWLSVIIAAYIGLVFLVYFCQDYLLFFPQRLSAEKNSRLNERQDLEALEFRMSDGKKVRGWLLKKPAPAPLKLLFYYGGNAEELSGLIPDSEKFGEWSLVLVNYRGYGQSEGKPSETKLTQDALEIFDAMLKRTGVDPRHVVLMGRSLGTGVAVHVAAQRPHAGVILVSPYDSLVHVAQRHYPIFPVNLMLRHRFHSAQQAPAIPSPLLALVAREDSIVPSSHSRLLADHWGGKVDFIEIARADHNTLSFHSVYWQSIQDYLKKLALK